MLSVKWKYKCNYPNSLFDAEDYWNNLFHAGIIRFGDVGYILTTYGYIRAFYLQKKIRKGFTGCCKTKPYIK